MRKYQGNPPKRTKNAKVPSKSPLKEAVRKTTFIIISTALITYPLELPKTNAYFTDKITYSKVSKAYKDLVGVGLNTLRGFNQGAVRLFFDVHRFVGLKANFDVDFHSDILVITLNLPEGCGFKASDTIRDSVKVIYEGELIDIRPLDIETHGTQLKLTFNWSEIEKYIDSEDKTPSFDIAGKGAGEGATGLGERFVFSAYGQLKDLDWLFFDQMAYDYYIDGDRTIEIPDEGVSIHIYKFYVNDEEVPAEEVEWKLSSGAEGVNFDSGKLVVYSDALSSNIVITAKLKTNNYFADAISIELIKNEEVPFEEEPVDEEVNQGETLPEDDGKLPDDPTPDDDGDDGEDEDTPEPKDPKEGEETPTEPSPGDDGEDEDTSEPEDPEEGEETPSEPTPDGGDDEEDEDTPEPEDPEEGEETPPEPTPDDDGGEGEDEDTSEPEDTEEGEETPAEPTPNDDGYDGEDEDTSQPEDPEGGWDESIIPPLKNKGGVDEPSSGDDEDEGLESDEDNGGDADRSSFI